MITKNEFVKRWYYGTAKERLELAKTLCDDKSRKEYKELNAKYRTDAGCTKFAVTLGELVIWKFLDMRNVDYGRIPTDNLMKQHGDADFDNGGRIGREYLIPPFTMFDIRTTGCKCVTESNTITVPKHLLYNFSVFKVDYVYLVDGFYVDRKNQNRYSSTYGTFGPSDYASSHIILINMKTGEKKIVADHEKTCELIESILAK